MKKPDAGRLLRPLLSMIVSFITYFLLDYPIRVTSAFPFPAHIGIKSFMPFAIGVFEGPFGALGCALGGCLAGLLTAESTAMIWTEALCVTVIGCSYWMLWHTLVPGGHVLLDNVKRMGISLGLMVLTALAAGGIARLFLGEGAMISTMAGYLISGALVSTPVIILGGSVLCAEPVLPHWRRVEDDAEVDLKAGDSMGLLMEALEEAALRKQIPMKRMMEIENCLEEVCIRIRKLAPDADIHARFFLAPAASLRLTVPGYRLDPLRAGREEDDMDLVSLKLIRHRALRASCSHFLGETRIHLVV